MKPLILTILSLLLIQVCQAQRFSDVNTHVIVAIDMALGENEKNALANESFVKKTINRAISEHVPGGKLDEDDFFSVLHFGIGTLNTTLDDLTKPVVNDKGSKMVWNKYKGKDMMRFGDWMGTVYYQGRQNCSGELFSMITSSKPYSLKALKSNNDDQVANQTYLILITDEHYNGLDSFEKEFEKLQGQGSRLSKDKFYDECIEVCSNYFFIRVDEYPLGYDLKAIVFDVVYAAIPNIGILDFPANYNMRREQGGLTFDFRVKAVDDNFSLEGFELDLQLKNGKTVTTRSDKNGYVYLQVPFEDVDKDDIRVTSRAWIRPWDGKYNGTILSPYATSPHARAERLTTTQKLEYTEEFKAFGYSLPSFLWIYPRDNAAAAALLIEVIAICLGIILLIIIIVIINKTTLKYTPKNDEINLHQIGKP